MSLFVIHLPSDVDEMVESVCGRRERKFHYVATEP